MRTLQNPTLQCSNNKDVVVSLVILPYAKADIYRNSINPGAIILNFILCSTQPLPNKTRKPRNLGSELLFFVRWAVLCSCARNKSTPQAARATMLSPSTYRKHVTAKSALHKAQRSLHVPTKARPHKQAGSRQTDRVA